MNTEAEIIKAIAEHLGLFPEDLDRQTNLKDELNLNPIELNDLLFFLSQRFNVIFGDVDTKDVKKIDDLIVLVEDNLLE